MKEKVRAYSGDQPLPHGATTKGFGEVVEISKLTFNEFGTNYRKRLSEINRLTPRAMYIEAKETTKELDRDVNKALFAGGTILFEQITKGTTEALTGNKLFDFITNINPHALDGFHTFMQSFGQIPNILAWGIGAGGLVLSGVIAKRRGDHVIDIMDSVVNKTESELGYQPQLRNLQIFSNPLMKIINKNHARTKA